MSTLEIHGGRLGARPAGRPVSGRMQPTDEQVAGQVRRDVQQLASRSRLTGTALDKQAVAVAKTRHRGAVDLFGEEAIQALTRRLESGACNWCAARILCAANGKPLPPATPALRALLRSQCGRCKAAYDTLEVAEREQGHVAGLVAAGYSPENAAYQRPGDPRATGAIWPANRKTPVPSYYRPGRPR